MGQWSQWRKERAALYQRAPRIQRVIDTTKRVVGVSTIVFSTYAALVAHQAHNVVETPGFNAGKQLLHSSQQLYTHLSEDKLFMSGMKSYMWGKAQLNNEFNTDLDQFLNDCEEFGKHSEDLAVEVGKFVTVSPFISLEKPHQSQQYTLSRD